MKRVAPPKCSPSKRRGSLFLYYMMYMLLTSILLTSAGICVNSILKADRLDVIESKHINSLMRLEGRLREDASHSVSFAIEKNRLTITTSEQNILWEIVDATVKREERNGDALVTSNRFSFRRGSSAEFSQTTEAGVKFKLVEAPRSPNEEPGERSTVEVVLYSPVYPDAAETVADNSETLDGGSQ